MIDTQTTQDSSTVVDRRTRLRLRDLCDEVLASYRLAADRDLFSMEDREDAMRLTVSVVTR